MYTAQFHSEYRDRTQQQHRVKINDRACKRQQCYPKQPDSRRGGKASERLKPASILEFVD